MFRVKFLIDAEKLESTEDFLWSVGAGSISLSQDEDIYELLSTDIKILPGLLYVEATFDENLPEEVLEDLKKTFFAKKITQEEVIELDWQVEFEKKFPILKITEKFSVVPTHIKDKPTGTYLSIAPGLAFGTGDHSTTKMCLEWLCELDLRNKNVLDYGCGSGILGLSSLALGANSAWLVDNDEQAIMASKLNAGLNNMINVHYNENLENIFFEVVVANIYSSVLIELLPLFSRVLASGGKIGFTGVLAKDADNFLEKSRQYFNLKVSKKLGDWVFFENE